MVPRKAAAFIDHGETLDRFDIFNFNTVDLEEFADGHSIFCHYRFHPDADHSLMRSVLTHHHPEFAKT